MTVSWINSVTVTMPTWFPPPVAVAEVGIVLCAAVGWESAAVEVTETMIGVESSDSMAAALRSWFFAKLMTWGLLELLDMLMSMQVV